MAKPSKIVTINLDKERHLRFNLNSLILVEDLTGKKMAEFSDEKAMSLKVLRALLFAGLKWEDKDLTEEQVGEFVEMSNMKEVNKKLEEAMQGLN
jgi:hypothetical protein